MKRVVTVLVLGAFLICLLVTPVLAGGGPPNPNSATMPVDGASNDNGDGTGWEEPVTSIITPLNENTLSIEADASNDKLGSTQTYMLDEMIIPIFHIIFKYGIVL